VIPSEHIRANFICGVCGNNKRPKNAFATHYEFSATDVVLLAKFIYVCSAVPEIRARGVGGDRAASLLRLVHH
jgi:hypothetical protein